MPARPTFCFTIFSSWKETLLKKRKAPDPRLILQDTSTACKQQASHPAQVEPLLELALIQSSFLLTRAKKNALELERHYPPTKREQGNGGAVRVSVWEGGDAQGRAKTRLLAPSVFCVRCCPSPPTIPLLCPLSRNFWLSLHTPPLAQGQGDDCLLLLPRRGRDGLCSVHLPSLRNAWC